MRFETEKSEKTSEKSMEVIDAVPESVRGCSKTMLQPHSFLQRVFVSLLLHLNLLLSYRL